ncbi:MAG: asparagine--tRNA ligase [Clostridia bacterium]|jgi:asparaginyl-tRNA synthetase|nr:asparagine--tRNA ligase [Clostridia bacterium]
MEKILSKQLFQEPEAWLNKKIVVQGWVRTLRVSKNFGFIELNDGAHFKNVQVVITETLANYAEITKLNVGSALTVGGTLTESPGAKQPFELQAEEVIIEGASIPEYPLQKKRHSFEFLRTMPHLRPRTNTFSAVFRVRSLLAYAIHRFFQERGFLYVHTPIITASDAEGAGELFRVTTLPLGNPPRNEMGGIDFTQDFFGQETNLTVSGQLEGEAYCLAFHKIYTFGPTFRAENSNTARHAAEFWMIEPEIAFAGLRENRALAEEMLKYLIDVLLKEAPAEMEFFNAFIDQGLLERLENVRDASFVHITYTEAIELLIQAKADFAYPVKWGLDLQTEHERYLTEKIFKKPVFVTDYPREIKAFYMRSNDDDKTVAAMDLLVPGVGEIIGGSQREERLDLLTEKMVKMGMKPEDYQWYLELRKYGGTRHAGFGLGFERLIMYMTGMTNIRDVIPFPRTVNNVT